MLTFSELKLRCEKAIARPPNSDSEETVSILFQNDWVRILTVCDSDNSEKWRIEVEMSLPSKKNHQYGKDAMKFIQNLIQHLEYLIRLDGEGLTLDVLSRDGLWIAYTEIEDLPSDDLFRALIPP
ncbi:MAG: hypothetical protein ACFFDQ_06245 [Candidatus Thorarchaeota archaeon]